jgi:hypothetical protein
MSEDFHLYLKDLKLMFQRLAISNKPALLQLEPDFIGYLQQYAKEKNVPVASIKAKVVYSDLPECKIFANTIKGYFNCVITLRNIIAPKVKIGFMPSQWGDWFDLADPAAPAIEKGKAVGKFLSSLNIAKADFVVFETRDRDAGFWEVQGLKNEYWTDTQFKNHLAWTKAVVDTVKKPAMWWQTPFGVPSDAFGTDGMYRDNRVKYFFSHLDQVVASGGFAIAFGAGADKQTMPGSDGGQFKTALDNYLLKPIDLSK